jgi:carbon-monoxide dehydrogenase medium subunit
LYPSKFEYVRATSVDNALELLSQNEDSKLLAGGHSLIPLMKFRLASPSLLVDIGRLKELSYIADKGDYVAIGALTRHRDVETSSLLAEAVPMLPHVASLVGDPQVRHRGTLGGTVAHGDGASDLPAALLALEATMVVQGPRGTRSVKASEFFKGFMETAISEDEILTEIQVPKGLTSWSYQKFNRRAQDWAIVGVAAAKNGSTRVALVNMGATPLRSTGAESALASGASGVEAAKHAADGITPPADLNASTEYRRHLATVLVGRAFEEMNI